MTTFIVSFNVELPSSPGLGVSCLSVGSQVANATFLFHGILFSRIMRTCLISLASAEVHTLLFLRYEGHFLIYQTRGCCHLCLVCRLLRRSDPFDLALHARFCLGGVLGGSWLVISGVISRVTIVITHIRGLITPLITTHEPPSTPGQLNEQRESKTNT